ncbi:MAG: S9 family peptidase [Gemmatimonadota bacterium]|nr:S9 family peptidase [Gemmatimonadota bacterium]
MRLVRSLVACCVLVSAPAVAQTAAKRPLTVEDYYRLKTIGAVNISPDGKWVAYTVSSRVEESNGNTSELWVVPSDEASAPRRISAANVNAAAPVWNDDGRLEYTAGGTRYIADPARPGSEQVVPPDTSAGRGGATVGRGGVAGGSPGGGGRAGGGRGAATLAGGTPSPDGRWTLAVRDVPPRPRPATQQTDFEKRHAERFKGIQFDWLDYQRDGGAYPLPNVSDPYVTPPQEIFITGRGAQGYTGVTQLTHLGLRPTSVQWAPGSNGILFTADSAYRSELSYGRTEPWLISVPDGEVRRITRDARYDYRGARYSPDGKWILMTRQFRTDHVIAQKLDHGGATDLVVLSTYGGPEKNLTEAWDFLPAGAQWSPDGSWIYFTGGVGGSVHLFRVSPNGGAVEQMTKGERRIGDLSFDKTMTRIAYTVNTFDGPAELWSSNIDGTGEKQLTRVHTEFAGAVTLARAERLQYTSADGTPIEGWLMLPPSYRANGPRVPLIVSNHGGPHSAIQYGFNFKNQYFAAQGYAVLEVNFRSSTGYGEKFLWGTWGAWGTKDGQDVMAGVDHVLGKYPNLDRTRVASIGHSYGGFMTNWLITQYPDRFAAAASGAGIVNWMSDYGNADIARTKETEFYGTPWEERAREIMIKQSPLTYAGRAKAPTLFIVGEIDRRVPFSENEQMYVALKKNGVPAKMIQYANMPHAISGHWNVVHRMLNERGWFDQYLRAPTVP